MTKQSLKIEHKIRPKYQAIILAAGKGSRMNSNLQKVLHRIGNKTIIDYILTTLAELNIILPVIVVGYESDQVIKSVKTHWPNARFAIQPEQKGTGDAVKIALPFINQSKPCFVANGDHPFFTANTYLNLIKSHQSIGAVFSLITMHLDDPGSHGRVIRDSTGKIIKVVQVRDASEKELQIKDVDVGLYVVNPDWVKGKLSQIKLSSATSEYNLMSVISGTGHNEYIIGEYHLNDYNEAIGINSPEHLKLARQIYKNLEI